MRLFKTKLKIKGFTIIEILVVISIIGILASVISFSVRNAQQKGGDTRKKSDLAAIRGALDLYFQENGYYPYDSANPGKAAFLSNEASGWIPELVPKYIKQLPKDPLQSGLIKILAGLFSSKGKSNSAVLAAVSPVVVDSTGDVGPNPAIVLDSTGNPIIAYHADLGSYPSPGAYSGNPSPLKLAHCGNQNCTSGNSIVTVDGAASFRTAGVSITLDGLGFPVVAYRDYTGENLKVLHCGNANCTAGNTINSIAIPAHDVYAISLVLNGSGFPVMAVGVGGMPQTLYAVTCGDANCSTGNTVVTPENTAINTGYMVDIELDSNGFPIVAYRYVNVGSSIQAAVKLLHCGNATCTSGNLINTVLQTPYDNAAFISLALDSSGFPVISWNNYGDKRLDFAHCGDANCSPGGITFANVDSAGWGGSTSLALDSSGFPVISYFDGVPNDDLKFVHCGNKDCTSGNSIVTLDSSGLVGSFNSMVIDSASGIPVIAYYDGTNGNLKLIRCPNSYCSDVPPPTSSPIPTSIPTPSPVPIPSPAPSPLPIPSGAPNTYMYIVSIDRQSYTLWALLENTSDSKINIQPNADCKDPAPSANYNYCVKPN